MAMMHTSELISMLESTPQVSSCSNSCSKRCLALDAWSLLMTNPIPRSDDACEIILTLTPTCCNALKIRASMPTSFCKPLPSILTIAIAPMAFTAFIALFPPVSLISVPVFSGLKLLRIRNGICFSISGINVCGCSTFAPKCTNSFASL